MPLAAAPRQRVVPARSRRIVRTTAADRLPATSVAVTSPQGNSFAIIEAASGKVVAVEKLTEVCGVAPDHAGFIVTTGTGTIVEPGGKSSQEDDYVWDNHMLRIRA